jgi:hypothetical protein
MSGVDSIATIAVSPFTLTFFVPGLMHPTQNRVSLHDITTADEMIE